MKSKNDVKLSGILICISMLLIGFATGLNVGVPFTERPDFIISIISSVFFLLSFVAIPFVIKKEKAKAKKNNL